MIAESHGSTRKAIDPSVGPKLDQKPSVIYKTVLVPDRSSFFDRPMNILLSLHLLWSWITYGDFQKVKKLLATLSPLVLSALARRKGGNQSEADSNQVGSLLRREAQQAQEEAPHVWWAA